jgi:hypothetical protein
VLDMQILNKNEPRGKFDFNRVIELIDGAEASAELDFDSPDMDEMFFSQDHQKFHPFPDWWLKSFPSVYEHQWALDYLNTRDPSEAVVDFFDLRADTVQKRICVPVRDFSGELMGLHGRAINPEDALRYRMYTQQKKNNPLIWLGEHYVDLDQPVVVVEGMFDVFSVFRVYPNVVSPLFASPSFEKLKRMADAPKIITLLDHGKGGDAGRKRYHEFTHGEAEHVLPPLEEDDAGSMTIPELIEVLGPHVDLRSEPLD